jgi:hypothetical protein
MSHLSQVTKAHPIASKSARLAIVAARIGANLGYANGRAYAAKHGVDARLVRLACQLEAIKRAGVWL